MSLEMTVEYIQVSPNYCLDLIQSDKVPQPQQKQEVNQTKLQPLLLSNSM